MDTQNPQTTYIPSTLEKKKAVTCILFMGILMSLVSQSSLSVYENYYLAISIGWWSLGLMVIVIIMLSLLVSFFLFISLPLFIIRFIFGGILIHQAWNWIYNHQQPIFRLCAGLWYWLLSLFEVQSLDKPADPIVS